jgi:hypothetical protein
VFDPIARTAVYPDPVQPSLAVWTMLRFQPNRVAGLLVMRTNIPAASRPELGKTLPRVENHESVAGRSLDQYPLAAARKDMVPGSSARKLLGVASDQLQTVGLDKRAQIFHLHRKIRR